MTPATHGIDLREGSRTHGKKLSADNMRQMFVPEGFAYGFVVTSETALFAYKVSGLYAPEMEGSVAWDDPDLGIRWPVEAPVLSKKDRAAPRLADLTSPFSFSP